MRRLIYAVSCVVLLTFFLTPNAQGQQPHRSVTDVSMKNVVEGALLLIILAGAIGGVWNRIKLGKGIGLRFIQYLGLTVLVPIIVILSLEGRIGQEMTGAIAAAAVGAILAGIGKDEL
jgi:phosphate starvation-inducible membrane PsiE